MARKTYSNYKPEQVYHLEYKPSVYEKQLEKQQALLEAFESKNRTVAHTYRTTTINSGPMKEVIIRPAFFHKLDHDKVKTYQPTSAKQKALNNKNAQRKIVRLVNSNFKAGDIFFTGGFTAENMPTSLEDCKRLIANFIKRIKRHMKKVSDEKLKYIYVIESKQGKDFITKYHVHMILSANAGNNNKGVDGRDQVEQLWNGGIYTNTKRLQLSDSGFTGISTYFTKQFEEMDETEESYQRRWGQSLGLKKWTRKPQDNYFTFKKKNVRKMVEAPGTMKEEFEKRYPGYQYNEDYPCQIGYNEIHGGFYLYCRMYQARE